MSLAESFGKGLERYINKPTLYDWVNKNRMLVKSSSHKTGKFRVDYVKPAIEVYKSYETSSEITGMLPSQLLKTELIININLYHADVDPTSILLLEPTGDLVKDVFTQRILPTFRSIDSIRDDSPIVSQYGYETHKKIQTTSEISLPNGFHLFGNSPGQTGSVISRPIQIVLYDEVDKGPNVIQEARSRLNTYSKSGKSKFIMMSTPSDEISSIIYQRWKTGSQGIYMIPCKKCKKLFTPSSKTLHYFRKKVWIKCSNIKCKTLHSEKDRVEMIDKGRYVHKYPERRHRSFTCTHIVGPFLSLEELWVQYQEAEKERERTGDESDLAMYHQTNFAEPYSIYNTRLGDINTTYSMASKPGQIPDYVTTITAAIDVQENRIECEIVGWYYDDGHICQYGIQYFTIMGSPHTMYDGEKKKEYVIYVVDQSTFRKAFEIIHKPYYLKSDKNKKLAFPISKLCIDRGYETGMVRGICDVMNMKLRTMRSRTWLPIKGTTGINKLLINEIESSKTDKRRGGIGSKIKNAIIYTDSAKSIIYNRLKYDTDTKDKHRYFSFNTDIGAGYCDKNKKLKPAYYEGLFSEEPMKLKGGKVVYQERYKGVRNEPLDLKVYNLAAIHFYALDRNLHDPVRLLLTARSQLDDKLEKYGIKISKGSRSKSNKK